MIFEKTYDELKEIDLKLKEKVKKEKKYTKYFKEYLNTLIDNLDTLISKWKGVELSDNSKLIYNTRYRVKYKDGKRDETVEDIWRRIARSIVSADTYYTDDIELLQLEENLIYSLLESKIFLPNSPVIFNVGKGIEKLYFEKDVYDMKYKDYVYIRDNQKTKNTTQACFKENEPITTINGVKPISQITTNDIVLTNEGNYKKVIETMIRDINEDIYLLDIAKLPKNSINVTKEHPFYAIKRKNIQCIRNKNLICIPPKKRCYKKERNYKEDCKYLYEKRDFKPDFVEVQDLRIGDYIHIPYPHNIVDVERIDLLNYVNDNNIVDINGKLYYKLFQDSKKGIVVNDIRVNKQIIPITRYIEVDNDFMRFAGLYIAQGNIYEKNGNLKYINFTLNIKNKDEIDFLVNYFKKIGFNDEHVYVSKTQKYVTIRYYSNILTTFMYSLFGKHCYNKKMPNWFVTLPYDKQKYLLKGIYSDGVAHKTNVTLSLTSKNIIDNVFYILLRLGIVPNLSSPKMYKSSKHPVYTVSYTINDEELLTFTNFLFEGRPYKNNQYYMSTIKNQSQYIKYKGEYYFKITDIKTEHFNGKVYNLEVEDDHTYTANYTGVHNCFVLSIDDNLENIMDTFKEVALISGAGGGIGINFSTLRPEYSEISSGGYSSGALSFLKTFNELGENILEGGIRRFAGMAILGFADFNKKEWWNEEVTFHPDIIDFINLKHNNNGESVLSNFNVSIGINNSIDFLNKVKNNEKIKLTFNSKKYSEIVPKDFNETIYNKLSKEDKKRVDIKLNGEISAKKLFRIVTENAWKTGDPGFIFLDKANKYNPLRKYIDIRATNPCVVGDTYVNVADGRGFVKIKDLAEEGKDVSVYSINPKTGKTEIKMMRRPRKTGEKHKIYKVILDDGSYIRCNKHHEFILSDLTTKKVTELKPGDSLLLQEKYLVKDKNGKIIWNDNVKENKKIYHENMSKVTSGLKNGRAYNITNEELEKIIYNYVKTLNYPISRKEWIEYAKNHNLPTKSKFRDITSLLRKVNNDIFKIPYSILEDNYAFRKLRTKFKKYSKLTNYPLVYINNEIHVIKKCENCGKEFTVPFNNREIGFCSLKCYNEYKKNHFVNPKLQPNVNNHKVVKVIEDGIEDVYNGTVDDNHNFGIGLINEDNFDVNKINEKMEKGEVTKFLSIVSLNCGERPNLSSSKYNMITPCNLASIDVSKFILNNEYRYDLLENVSEIILHFLDLTIDLMMFPLDKIKKGVLLLRDAGLGFMGLHGAMILQKIQYESEEGLSFGYKIMKTIEVGSTNMSYILGEYKYKYMATSDVDNNIYTAEIWNKENEELEKFNNNKYYNIINEKYKKLKNRFKKEGYNKKLRNISRTSIQPTGCVVDNTSIQFNNNNKINLKILAKEYVGFDTDKYKSDKYVIIEDENGNIQYLNKDNTIIVIRNGNKVKIKVKELKEGDKIV